MLQTSAEVVSTVVGQPLKSAVTGAAEETERGTSLGRQPYESHPNMNQNTISLSGQVYGGGSAPLIIAELSGNHGQSLDTALKLVERAADAGARECEKG